MASMRNWLKDPDAKNDGRVVVVHCKAGKGRSGTVACSYLISEEGWRVEDALARFTERRMRTGFGEGVSIPSQLRWVGYVNRWSKHGKMYVERQVEILEVHVWGLKDGVKVAVEGFVDEGRTIKTFHTFNKHERLVVDERAHKDGHCTDLTSPNDGEDGISDQSGPAHTSPSPPAHPGTEVGGAAVLFRPKSRLVLPTNDINIDFERRNGGAYHWTVVTSVAHVWFNAFFEGAGPENSGVAASNGVFGIEWDAMDGVRGSSKKGIRAFERLEVVWRALDSDEGRPTIITEPQFGEPVPQAAAADWQHATAMSPTTAAGKDLGLRVENPQSANLSQNSSFLKSLPTDPSSSAIATAPPLQDSDDEVGIAGVKSHGIGIDHSLPLDFAKDGDHAQRSSNTGYDKGKAGFVATVAGIMRSMRQQRHDKHAGSASTSTSDSPDVRRAEGGD